MNTNIKPIPEDMLLESSSPKEPPLQATRLKPDKIVDVRHMHSLTPHLVCRDANAAMDFYIQAFGATDEGRMPGPDGKLMHGMLRIGDSALILVYENPEWGMLSPLSLNGSPVIVHLYVKDVDATIAQAVVAGARVTMPAEDMFWGDRYGRLVDPFGHEWSVAAHLRDLHSEVIQAAMKNACPEA